MFKDTVLDGKQDDEVMIDKVKSSQNILLAKTITTSYPDEYNIT
jgi:hypothetical protein